MTAHVPGMAPQPPAHMADRFLANRLRIAASIRAADTAREACDKARTPQSYGRAVRALHRAQDEHTAAHAEHAALCDEWSAHFASTYGPERVA